MLSQAGSAFEVRESVLHSPAVSDLGERFVAG